MSPEKSIFKNASSTYYFSTKFFPKKIRQDVFRLYSFVRTADDYVDSLPANKKAFNELKNVWLDSIKNKNFDSVHYQRDSLNVRVVKNMVYLARKYGFDPKWVDAFLASMQADLDKKSYANLGAIVRYTYGSAEVIGLMMSKIMGLPDAAMPYAALQGRAMQWINFIRDIQEDNQLGRSYFPQEDLNRFGLKNLAQSTAKSSPTALNDFIQFQLSYYHELQQEAEKGFTYIPKRIRMPLETAVENYNWTARQIAKKPQVIYLKKVRPLKFRVLTIALSKTAT